MFFGGRPVRRGDCVVAGAVVSLFAVPALLLGFDDKPSRFGFQMYSGYGGVEATWRDGAGADHPVVLSDFLTSPRTEVDWLQRLPDELCRRIAEATSVEVRQHREEGTVHRRAQC